jgi:hypothetical protein
MTERSRALVETEVESTPATPESLAVSPLQPRLKPPVASPPSGTRTKDHSVTVMLDQHRCDRQTLGSRFAVASPCQSPANIAASRLSPSFITPIGTPIHRTLHNLQHYLEEVGHTTTLNVRDTWLPLTESRNGNTVYAAFHNLNAMIGYQAIFLPFAFMYLGWYVYIFLHDTNLFTQSFIFTRLLGTEHA